MRIPNEIETRLRKHFDAATIDGISMTTTELLEAADSCRLKSMTGLLSHYSSLSRKLEPLELHSFRKGKSLGLPKEGSPAADALDAILDLWDYVDRETEDRLKEHCGCRLGQDPWRPR